MKKYLALLLLLLLPIKGYSLISNVTYSSTSTTVTINWRTDVLEGNDYVAFAKSVACSNLSQTATTTSSCSLTHSVTVTGLQVGT